MRHYSYVGPHDIREKTRNDPPGPRIESPADLDRWLESLGEQLTSADAVTATFTVDPDGFLRLVSRHAEHVACAGGGPVLSAGEMTFEPDGDAWHVTEVSNQSTGFCPQRGSWAAVAEALDRSGIPHPGRFTTEIVFRRCPSCGQRNLVKDEWYVCAVCDGDLPVEWVFDS
jgi:hypothetical protein